MVVLLLAKDVLLLQPRAIENPMVGVLDTITDSLASAAPPAGRVSIRHTDAMTGDLDAMDSFTKRLYGRVPLDVEVRATVTDALREELATMTAAQLRERLEALQQRLTGGSTIDVTPELGGRQCQLSAWSISPTRMHRPPTRLAVFRFALRELYDVAH